MPRSVSPAFTELPFLFVLWRYWGTWLHYLGAAILGVVIADRLRRAGVGARLPR